MNLSERDKAMTLQKHQPAFIKRLTFMRKGSLSYIGHLDLMRTMEHALRRAGLPILHSQGYNPRPMLVFALPLGVGIATEADYVDVSFSEETDTDFVIKTLNANLPADLRILDGWTVPESAGSIMALVTAASYRLKARGIRAAVQSLMTREEIMAEKKSKGQLRTLNIRPLILKVLESDPADPDEVNVLVLAGSHENLRPDLLLNSLSVYEGYPERDGLNCEVVRTGLFTGVYPDIKPLKECT